MKKSLNKLNTKIENNSFVMRSRGSIASKLLNQHKSYKDLFN